LRAPEIGADADRQKRNPAGDRRQAHRPDAARQVFDQMTGVPLYVVQTLPGTVENNRVVVGMLRVSGLATRMKLTASLLV
jgi:hypothetical protein